MPYDPYNNGAYQHMNEQLGFPHQTSGHRAKQHLPRRDIIADAQTRRQAAEREARARNLRESARVPPEAYPWVRKQPLQQEDALEEEADEDEELYTRAPRSAVRYQPEAIYRQGNTQVNKYTSPPPPNHKHAIPPRRSAQYPQPEAELYQQDVYTNGIDEEAEHPQRYRRRIHYHWLVFAGIGLLLMLAGSMAFSDLGGWWQNHQDDVTYGMPRTYQTDAVVGHGDSNSNPSHFIAINLRGSIYVIEAPGGNFSKAREYFIMTEVGGNPNPPVTIKFQDLTHSGRLDMVVTIGDPPTPLIVFLLNNGSQFVAKSQ